MRATNKYSTTSGHCVDCYPPTHTHTEFSLLILTHKIEVPKHHSQDGRQPPARDRTGRVKIGILRFEIQLDDTVKESHHSAPQRTTHLLHEEGDTSCHGKQASDDLPPSKTKIHDDSSRGTTLEGSFEDALL